MANHTPGEGEVPEGEPPTPEEEVDPAKLTAQLSAISAQREARRDPDERATQTRRFRRSRTEYPALAEPHQRRRIPRAAALLAVGGVALVVIIALASIFGGGGSAKRPQARAHTKPGASPAGQFSTSGAHQDQQQKQTLATQQQQLARTQQALHAATSQLGTDRSQIGAMRTAITKLGKRVGTPVALPPMPPPVRVTATPIGRPAPVRVAAAKPATPVRQARTVETAIRRDPVSQIAAKVAGGQGRNSSREVASANIFERLLKFQQAVGAAGPDMTVGRMLGMLLNTLVGVQPANRPRHATNAGKPPVKAPIKAAVPSSPSVQGGAAPTGPSTSGVARAQGPTGGVAVPSSQSSSNPGGASMLPSAAARPVQNVISHLGGVAKQLQQVGAPAPAVQAVQNVMHSLQGH